MENMNECINMLKKMMAYIDELEKLNMVFDKIEWAFRWGIDSKAERIELLENIDNVYNFMNMTFGKFSINEDFINELSAFGNMAIDEWLLSDECDE